MPHDASEAVGATHDGAMETRGLEPVPDAERTGRVRELFPTWVAANISVLLLTMGAGLIVFNGLNFWQVLTVAIAAPVLSYGIVGLISIAGKRGGAPGMALSRAVFGQRGNLFPGALIWVARWGWETINAVTGAYAVLTVLDLLFGVKSNTLLIVVTLLLFVTCTFLVSGLGINALRVCSKWSTYLFGAFSVLVLVYLVANTDWSAVFDKPAGSTAMMVAGIGTIAAGGISWVPSGPDFTRYLPRTASSKAMVGSTVGGAGIVVLPMVLMGAVMAVSTPDLASAQDPVSFIGELLPMWISVPYLVIALLGMLLINSMSMYSAGFTAQTLGIKVSRAAAVSVNAVISLVFGFLLMVVATSFIGSFISFLTLLAVAFSAWIGVFGVDMLRRRTYDAVALMDTTRTSAYWYRGGFAWQAMTAWAVALLVGLLFTKVDWFSGPLASSWIGENGLGWAATILVAGVLYAVLPRTPERAPVEPIEVRETVSI
ncbi:Cytosine or purine or uracil or thiamine or allantoin permease family protein [Streptomyces venezuelae]|uniref:cytosine permease n=1 Tax=Streptomyces gardneri TaxID=66892 RepID=UPI0006BD9231|nr:cytosine permease [Streptomyces gardneri]ALO11289.1 Cytosine or purine or uracil or thiamine or allantoin permease family protein [Streptomyces venezuelae]QPK48209.1 cytosine permease [Streptomyces gardneri]WRK39669.1 cytosine permease [Streptomyces venezuelae]CUM38193.1 Cytosine/purine/uracil/thiamine/allantoin permease family protein [Streptomyces venezuelae]